MTRLMVRCLLAFLTTATTGPLLAAEADNDPWAAFRFLVGEWVGEGAGQAGEFSGGFTFRPELHGRVMVRRQRAARSGPPSQPPEVHEDLMIVYPAPPGQPMKAVSWDRDGHVIHFEVHPAADGRSLSLVSEPGEGRPRLRLRYDQQAPGQVAMTFATAPPETPDQFQTRLQATARRKPRSEVGSELPRGYVCRRADGPITIDGKLDEKAWLAVPWTEPFVDIEGDLKPRPRLNTQVRMLWDDQYLYVAAYLEEPHVWGTLTKHDSVIFQDNDFEIFIDPDGDNHEYYEIEINALNTEWDLFLKKPYRDGGPAVDAWEIPGLKTAVHVEGTLNDPRDRDRFWSVEFAIPWKVLSEYAHRPAPPKDGDQWRINFSRVQWQHEVEGGKYRKRPRLREDNWVWSPQGFVDMHRPEYWGVLQFSTEAPGAGPAAYRPDPASPIRDRLIEIYQAQKTYHEKHQRWSDTLEALGLPPGRDDLPRREASLRTSAEGFEASLSFQPEQGERQTWTIRQDSRIQRRP